MVCLPLGQMDLCAVSWTGRPFTTHARLLQQYGHELGLDPARLLHKLRQTSKQIVIGKCFELQFFCHVDLYHGLFWCPWIACVMRKGREMTSALRKRIDDPVVALRSRNGRSGTRMHCVLVVAEKSCQGGKSEFLGCFFGQEPNVLKHHARSHSAPSHGGRGGGTICPRSMVLCLIKTRHHSRIRNRESSRCGTCEPANHWLQRCWLHDPCPLS